MLTGFNLTNYKAFEDGTINIKPITILLGANSIGKSSLMQFILLLKQSFNFSDEYESALKLNGEYINLGIPNNIFRNFDTSKSLIFSVKASEDTHSFDASDISFRLESNLEILIRQFEYDEAYAWEKIFQSNKKKKTLYDSIKPYSGNDFVYNKLDEIQKAYQNQTSVIDKAKELVKRYKKYKKNLLEAKNDSIISANVGSVVRNSLRENHNIEAFSLNDFTDSIDFLNAIEDVITEELTYEYKIDFEKKGNNLRLASLKIINDRGEIIIGYSKEKSKNGRKIAAIHSDFLDNQIIDKYRVDFGNKVEFHLLELVLRKGNDSSQRLNSDLFINTFYKCFQELLYPLYSSMNETNINYVSPLRAFPKRYYFLDDAKFGSSLDTISGENLAEILKKNKTVRTKVNDWLQRFGFEVNVNKLQDVIHSMKVNQSGLKLDITDVGFGISQILPVIVQGFLANENSATLIEQPEIHLHPKMQAELADLFIDIVKSSDELGRNLLIETHSEYLLRRLRRRISEKKISSHDVAIYFIKKDKNKSIIEEVDISESGAFDWPEEFYMDELDDNLAFLKNQPMDKI